MIAKIIDSKVAPLSYSSLLKALKEYDLSTYNHSLRVADNAYYVGGLLNLDANFLDDLYLGGKLHDIGKLKIPKDILLSTENLTISQRKIIEKHPLCGYELLRDIKLSDVVLNCVKFHHEKLDGSGYPSRITVDKIPLEAKIVAVCDVYDALTHNRPYKKAFNFSKVEKILTNMAEDNLLDKEITIIFLNNKSEMLKTSSNKIVAIDNKDYDSKEHLMLDEL